MTEITSPAPNGMGAALVPAPAAASSPAAAGAGAAALAGPVLPAPPPAPPLTHYTYDEIRQMAADIVRGGLFAHLKTPEQVLTLMLICQAKGLHPIAAVERYDIINGRPAMKTAAMLAEFQRAGGQFRWEQSEDECVVGCFAYPGAGEMRVRWDKARAVKAQLWGKGGPWQTYPQQMLRARCISEAVRALAPGVLSGIYSEEEVRDMPPLVMSEGPPAPRPGLDSMPANRSQQQRQQAAPAPPAPSADGRRSPTDQALIAAQLEFLEDARHYDFDVMRDDNPEKPSEPKTKALLKKVEGFLKYRLDYAKPADWKTAANALPHYVDHLRAEDERRKEQEQPTSPAPQAVAAAPAAPQAEGAPDPEEYDPFADDDEIAPSARRTPAAPAAGARTKGDLL